MIGLWNWLNFEVLEVNTPKNILMLEAMFNNTFSWKKNMVVVRSSLKFQRKSCPITHPCLGLCNNNVNYTFSNMPMHILGKSPFFSFSFDPLHILFLPYVIYWGQCVSLSVGEGYDNCGYDDCLKKNLMIYHTHIFL